MSALILDLETTTKEAFGRKANPFINPEQNKIVCLGYKHNRWAGSIYYNDIDFNNIPPYIYSTNSTISFDTIIGHNIKFDLLHLWKIPKLQTWLKAGGKIVDTAINEYYLTSFQTNLKFREQISLKYLAEKKYNQPFRPKYMEEYWNKSIDTFDIPKEIVIEDVLNDVTDTEAMYLAQTQEIEKRGLQKLLEVQMDALLCTAEMEYNGFMVDKKTLSLNELALNIDLTGLKGQLSEIIEKYMPLTVYDDQPSKALKALLFGGELEETVKEPELIDGIPIVYKSGQKKNQIKLRNVVKIHKIKGFGLIPQPEWMTNKGNISVNEQVLNELVQYNFDVCSEFADDIVSFAKILLEIRKLEKQLNTYYKGFKDLIYLDNCIRSSYNHTMTETGRLSSSNPNLQNIPREGHSKVKEHFVTRYL